MQGFRKGEVVFIIAQSFKYGLMPATITRQSGYKAYQIRIYGDKTDTFVNQYNMLKFTNHCLKNLQDKVQKNNKKMIKLLKKAEKDFKDFEKKPEGHYEEKELERLYLKEEQMDDNGDDQLETRYFQNKVEAIRKTKVKILVEDFYQKNGRTLLKYNDVWGMNAQTEQDTKTILILKLKFALDELMWEVEMEKNKLICQQIMTSNVIDPIEYLTSPLFYKINEYLQENSKKGSKNPFYKFLNNQKELFLKNLDNYLDNYSVFKDARDQICQIFTPNE